LVRTLSDDGLRAKAWGAPVEFAWRSSLPLDATIHVVEASYGESCQNCTPKYPAPTFSVRQIPVESVI
jgi:hypothetical protein